MSITTNDLLLLETHKQFVSPKTQEQYYKDHGSSEDILQYVRLQGKTFGEKWCEKLAREYFNLDPRKGSGHDHCKLNKTIEQKSSRYGSNGADWKWQHIEMKHHFDYLLLTGLDFNGFNFYITKRSLVEELINKNIITGQGKKDTNGIAQPQQAYWFERKDFKKKGEDFTNYFTLLTNEQSLIDYIQADTSGDSIPS